LGKTTNKGVRNQRQRQIGNQMQGCTNVKSYSLHNSNSHNTTMIWWARNWWNVKATDEQVRHTQVGEASDRTRLMRQCSNHRHHKTNKRYASRGKNNFHLHKQNQITIEWCDTINHGQHEWMQHHSHVHQSKTTVYVPPSTHHPKIMLNWIWRDKGGNRLQKGPNNKRKQPNVWM